MSAAEHFFDTKVLLYLLSADARKADLAEALIAQGGSASVQVLNELASVASRKLRMPWAEVNEVLALLRPALNVLPLTLATHEKAPALAQRHQLQFYDALIVAAALLAGCKTLWSEDMQHGQVFERKLTVRNPFRED